MNMFDMYQPIFSLPFSWPAAAAEQHNHQRKLHALIIRVPLFGLSHIFWLGCENGGEGDGKYRIKFTNFIVSKFLNKIYFLLYLAYFSVQKLVVETSSSRTLDTQNLGKKLESWISLYLLYLLKYVYKNILKKILS